MAGLLIVAGLVGLTVPALGQGTVRNVEILSMVPADSWGVALINDLSKAGVMLDQYMTKLGAEPVGLSRMISQRLGTGAQVDMGKPIVVVVLSKDLYGDQPVAVVLSVKDYEAFSTGFTAKPSETTPTIMKGSNEEVGEVFFTRKGQYVVMGPTEAIVKAVAGSKQSFLAGMEPDSCKTAKESDVFIRLNFQSLGQFIKPMLQMFGAMAQMNAMGAMGGTGEKGAGAGQTPEETQAQMQASMQSTTAMLNAVIGLIDELNGLDLAMKLEKEQVLVSSTLSFKGGQEMANLLAAQKMTNKSLLKGLPGGGFGMAIGWQWTPKKTKLQEAFMQAPPFSDPADAEKYRAVAWEMSDLTTGSAAKVDLRTPEAGQSPVAVQVILDTKNSKKYLEALRRSIELQSKVKVPTPDGKTTQVQFKYEPGVEKVDDLSLDRMTVDLSKVLGMPGMGGGAGSAEKAKGLIGMLTGGSGELVTLKAGAINDKAVLFDFGSDAAGLSRFVKLAKSGTAPLSVDTRIVRMASSLPRDRFFEGYIDLGKIMGSMSGMEAMIEGTEGEKKATTTKPAADPGLIGMAGSVQDAGVKMDLVIPLDVIGRLSALKGMVPMMVPGMGGGQ